MAGRHWNATAGENNSAKPWRDWFVLFAFGTACRMAIRRLSHGISRASVTGTMSTSAVTIRSRLLELKPTARWLPNKMAIQRARGGRPLQAILATEQLLPRVA